MHIMMIFSQYFILYLKLYINIIRVGNICQA